MGQNSKRLIANMMGHNWLVQNLLMLGVTTAERRPYESNETWMERLGDLRSQYADELPEPPEALAI